MRRIVTRNQKSEISKNEQAKELFPISYFLFKNACAKLGYKKVDTSRISTFFSHRLGYKKYTPVHKVGFYTPTHSTQTHQIIQSFALFSRMFNRLKDSFIPILHRAYIQNNKFNLMKI